MKTKAPFTAGSNPRQNHRTRINHPANCRCAFCKTNRIIDQKICRIISPDRYFIKSARNSNVIVF